MSARIGCMVGLTAVLLALAFQADAAEKQQQPKKNAGVIEGVITNNTLGLKAPTGDSICRITVKSAKDEGVLSITPQTKLFKREGAKQVMALPADLTPGSTVRAKFEPEVRRSRPWQGSALEVVILKQAK